MTMQCDKADFLLLQEYAQVGSQTAFAMLVHRYTDLVYGSARRQLCAQGCGDQAAEDVTQAVFLVLARKAGQIRAGVPLSSWLMSVTRYAVRNAIKAQRRRQKYENGAAAMRNESSTTPLPSEPEPMLDEGIAHLGAKDRDAILLRFAENRTLDEVGKALGVSGDAARVRVNRAVEKLRRFFAARGVTASSAMVVLLLEQTLTQHAPSHLAQAAITTALGEGASAGTQAIATSTVRTMAMAKLKVAAGVAAILLVGAAAGVGAWKMAGQSTATPPVASAQTGAAAPAADAAATRQAVLAVIAQFRDAMQADDRQAIDRLIAVPADTQGELLRLTMYKDAATIHVDRAWQSRFAGALSFKNLSFHWNSSMHANADALLSAIVEQATPSDVVINGSTAQMRVDLAKGYPTGEAEKSFGPWAKLNLGFVLADGAWRVDLGRSMRVDLSMQFTPGHAARDKQRDVVGIAFDRDILNVLDDAAARIERGDFASPQAARNWVWTQTMGVFEHHHLTALGHSVTPAK